MIRWLLENLGLMLLALIIALVVWIAAEWERDPIREGEFDQLIPVQVKNQPPGTFLVDDWQKKVRVHLRAPQSVWNQLKPADFVAVLNLSPNLAPLEAGSHWIPVDVSLDLEPSDILGIEPHLIQIELETMLERVTPISVEVRGEQAMSYQAEDPVVTPDTVKVRGPASLVDQVRQVVTSISLHGARETVKDETASLTPVDAAGKWVSGVTLDPEQVQVSVTVTQQSNFKEMTVKPEILGEPAPDYYIAEIRLDPSMVLVAGSRSVLDNLPGFLTTVPISIEGRTEDIVERLSLELPPGVATVNPNEPAVQLTIDIEPFLGSVTVTRTVTFQGLQPGLMAIASPKVVKVILSGSLARLSALLPEDVRVILDLSELRLGEAGQLTPVVVQPEGIMVDSVIPSVIQVQTVREATPAPEPQE